MKNKRKNNKNAICYMLRVTRNKGFTLVETLVAISIFTMSILGLMVVLGGGIANTNYAKQRIIASYLAQEGIEYVRNMRDTSVLYSATSQAGWDAFKVADKTYSSNITGFTRIIDADITSFGANEVKISSTVSWAQGSGSYHITFSENLYNWIE